MARKIGVFLVIGTVCAFLGYGMLQANPAERQAANNPASPSNMKAPTPKPAKVSEADLTEQRKAKIIEAGLDLEQFLNSDGTINGEMVESATFDVEKEAIERAALEAIQLMEAGEPLSPEQKDQLLRYLDAMGENNRPGAPNPLDNIGGPDGGSYFFVDNDGDSVTYEWIELRGDPEAIWVSAWSSTDDGYSSARHPIGFNFPFYGVMHDSVRFATNGFIQFTTSSTSLSNAALPSTNVAGPAIFPYWDDLHLTYGGQTAGNVVAYRNFGNYTVIEYDSIGFCCANGSELKFEVILFNDGRIKFQYNTMHVVNSEDSSMTIGIQSNGAAGSPALQYAYNLTGIQPAEGRAIWFYQHFYDHNFAATSIASPSGYYEPNTLVSVTARFTNAGLTTESAPVKYSFNGGPVQTEFTGVLAQDAFEDHTFAAQITTPSTPGGYTLTVWSDLATDEARGNDTLRTTIQVGGDNCASAIALTGFGPDSALFNNCAMTDNTPGQPCGASGKDMVFRIEVPNGYQAVLWQSSNNIDSRHTLRWGGACPGDNFIDCQDSPDEKKMRFVNQTGSTQTAYLVVGGWSTSTACGDLRVAWELTACGPQSAPVSEGFENLATPLLPNCWSIAQAFPLTATTSPLWENYATNPYSGTRVASILGAAVGNDDWLFSPGINLTAGSTYTVDFWWRGASATVPESLEVKAGLVNTAAGMTLTVFPMDTIKSTVYVQRTPTFTAPATGVYYIGFHNVTKRSAGRTYIDEAQLYVSGGCTAPTASVADSSGIGTVTMFCNAQGGSGGLLEYQWYTGQSCTPGNEIAGANSATYVTNVNGDYACKAWRADPDLCASCDWGTATVLEAPPGYDCTNPYILVGAEDSLAFNNCGMGHNSPGQSCGNSNNDMVFSMEVAAGNTATIYQYFNDFDSRHSLRWGGACPGTNVVGCVDDPDYTVYSWENTTGVTQNVYFVVGYYSSSNICGNFRLRWTNEVFVPPPGETCSDPFVLTPPVPGTPTVVSGNLANYQANSVDSCDYNSTGPDVFYSLTLANCTRISMALDDGSPTTGDMHVTVYEAAQCGTVNALLCNDDRGNYDTLWWEDPTQRSSYSLTSFVAAELPAGTYTIRVGHYGSGTSNYRLRVWDNGPCSCDIVCAPGDGIETAENIYDLTFQVTDPTGGCNNDVPSYGTVAMGQTICGRGFNYINTGGDFYRDTDWYQFTLASDATVQWQVNSEFRSLIGVIGSDCLNPVFISSAIAPACTLTTVEVPLVAGVYNAFVSPYQFVGNPLPSTYRATLAGACVPDTVDNLTVYRAAYPSNDVTLRWSGDESFPGTYTVYVNTVPDEFPGSWAILAQNIAPAASMTYVDTGSIGANVKRFYLVVSVCP